MSDIIKNDCQGEDMYSAEIPIEIELGSGGLYYGTSPSVKGLLVTGRSIKELMDKVPNAVAELKAVAAFAAEVSALKEKLKEAKQIIKVLADIDPSSLVEPGSEDDRYTLYLSKKRQAHEIHGDDLRRARAFLNREKDNG